MKIVSRYRECVYSTQGKPIKKIELFMINDKYLAQELRLAILTSQLHIAVQPKFCLNTMKVTGNEVLLQWEHPKYGFIQADRWVKIAEQHGLMTQLTLWLASKVCTLIQNNHDITTSYAINISPSCLNVPVAQFIIDKILYAKINPSLLEIEITESAAVENFSDLAKAVQLLRSHGIKVSLDDFGTGFSSMQYLVELEVDVIKIDKSFVQRAPNNKVALLTLKSMIELAKAIDISVVCEGIETQEQLRISKELGADQGQGYLFARPQLLERQPQTAYPFANELKPSPRKIVG